MRDCVLVLELGSARIRVTAVDRSLAVLAQGEGEIEQHHPQPGWSEFSPEAWWSALASTAQAVVRETGVQRLAGLALVSEKCGALLWERASGKPLYPAIASPDRRALPVCQSLKQKRREPMLHYRTGLFLDPDRCALKLHWLLEHVPGAGQRARQGELAGGGLESWALWHLTAGRHHLTDHGHASQSLLYDLATRQWEPQLLAVFGIPAALLPRVAALDEGYGETAAGLFGEPLPILAIATTAQAGLWPLKDRPGVLGAHYDQDLAVRLLIGRECAVQSSLFTSIAWNRAGLTDYYMEGPVLAGGSVLQWLAAGVGMLEHADQAGPLAASVPDTGGVYFVPALSGLGNPYGDPTARGLMVGLSTQTGRPHIVRAVLEGLAHQIADLAGLVEKGTRLQPAALQASGRLAGNDFLMQFQADLLGIPVERPARGEAALYGAVLMAGQASGQGLEQISPTPGEQSRIFTPALPEHERQQLRYRWMDAVERALGWERKSAARTD